MDRHRISYIAHRDFDFCNPISSAAFDDVLGRLTVPEGGRVLDVGCGKGELLVRLALQRRVRGTGLEPAAIFAADARQRASRMLAGGVEILELPAASYTVPDGSFDLAACVGASHAFGDLPAALRALQRLVRPGGELLVGEVYWRKTPAPEYLAALGARASDCRDYAGTIALAEECGLVPMYAATASESDWDRYEWGYRCALEQYVRAYPDEADHREMALAARSGRDAYVRWGRDTMGFVLMLLAV